MDTNSEFAPVPNIHEVPFAQQSPRHDILYQLFARISTPNGYERARYLTHEWLNRKWAEWSPGDKPLTESFERSWRGNRCAAVHLPERGIWSATVERLDPDVAGRTIHLDLTVFREHGGGFAYRAYCSSTSELCAPLPFEVPEIVNDLAQSVGLHTIRPLNGRPLSLDVEKDLDAFDTLMTHKHRLLPVVLLTEVDPYKFHVSVSRFVLNPEALAAKLLGLAHVVTLPKHLTYAWTDRVGREWSAFMGACRLFYPGIDFGRDDGHSHGFWMADRILLFEHQGERSELAFERFLRDQCFEGVAAQPFPTEALPFFEKAHSLSRGVELGHSPTEDDCSPQYREDAEELRRERDEAHGEVQALRRELDRAQAEIVKLRTTVDALRARLRGLDAPLTEITGHSSDWNVELAADMKAVPGWLDRYLDGRLLLHTHARRACAESALNTAEPACRALLLLAFEYRAWRLEGTEEARDAFDRTCREMGFGLSRTAMEARSDEQTETLSVPYPMPDGPWRLLEWSLVPGRDFPSPGVPLRVQFFWDQENRQVVVGSLGNISRID